MPVVFEGECKDGEIQTKEHTKDYFILPREWALKFLIRNQK